MKLIRWKYVLPRLLLLLFVGLCVRFGLDPALRWFIVTSGQAVTGAKVDLAEVKTSLRDVRLELAGLQAANANAPLRNLCEARQMEVVLDVNALLHRRVVVRSGNILGLQFDTQRETSGELEVAVEESATDLAPAWADKAQDLAGDWFAATEERFNVDILANLQTPQVAEALEARWKTQAADLRAQAEAFKGRGKQLETQLREIKSNPLRNADRIPALQAELKSVKQDLKKMQQQIKSLPQQAQADKEALLAAKKQDEAYLRQQLQFDRLDGDNLTQVLLGDTARTNLQAALDWIAWAREKMPASEAKKIAARRSRGSTVVFGGARPEFLIEQVNLELTAPVAGRPMQFTGLLTNVSSQPRLVAEPARLELAAVGDVPMLLSVESDRRTDPGCDRLTLECPALPLSGQTLGKSEKLALAVAPGTASLHVELELVGDAVSGHISFAQPQLEITPVVGPKTNATLAAVVGQAVSGLTQLSAEVTLAGTLHQPQFKIDSPVGKELAEGISTALAAAARERGEKLLAKVQGQADTQLAKITQARDKLEQDLQARLGEHQELLQAVAAFTGQGGQGLSVPQLSSKLGAGLLRK
jgi:uncharacterized protein (TIGR03545 family)